MWEVSRRADLGDRLGYEGELEDKGPKPFLYFSRGQLLRLRDFAIEQPHDVAVIDEGSGYLRAVLFDHEGEVVDSRLLPPV